MSPFLLARFCAGGVQSAVMSDVTQILSAIEQGNPHAAEQLLPLVYDELRKLAAQRLIEEKPGQTLQATALVHEAYLRLVDVKQAQPWNSRGHFFAAAAEAMRRILVDRARRKGRVRHGGGLRRTDLLDDVIAAPPDDDQLVLLDDAVTRNRAETAKILSLTLHLQLDHADPQGGARTQHSERHARSPAVRVRHRQATPRHRWPGDQRRHHLSDSQPLQAGLLLLTWLFVPAGVAAS
jgi:RNA polymerase sigma factor (TIGR02999 family)